VPSIRGVVLRQHWPDPVLRGWFIGASGFSADVYFLTIPAKLDWAEVGLIAVASVSMSFLATLPPAWRASRLDPVDALRYEKASILASAAGRTRPASQNGLSQRFTCCPALEFHMQFEEVFRLEARPAPTASIFRFEALVLDHRSPQA